MGFLEGRVRGLGFCLLAVFFVRILTSPPLEGQVANATVTGVVRDPTGAVIPGVKVVVTNVATNLEREASTDASGVYNIPSLNPGEYKIEAEGTGFKKAVLSGIILQVAQQGRVDITLEVGQLTESVTVKGAAPVIETESPIIGGVVNETRIIGLPLNGRNFMELTTLTAGINEGASSTAKFGILNKGFGPAAAGMPTTENNYQLDGADNKEGFFNTYNLAPSVDAVQEFRIQVGQYSAEFGAGGGAVINVVTKSGTNEFHGDVWEFVRNDIFDARNFFLAPTSPKAPLRRNQFGGAAGAPIVKNRAFLFANFETTRIRQGSFRSARVPTAAERAGDLSDLGKRILDPLNGQPFPGSVIPANRIDPIAAGILKYYPLPNNPSSAVTNWIVSPSSKNDLNSGLTRFDMRLSDRNDLMMRYGIQDYDRYTPGTFPLVGGQLQPQRFQNLAAGLTTRITPALLNEFHASYGRTVNRTKGQNTGTPIAADLGVPFALRDSANAGFIEGVGLGNTVLSGISEGQPWFLTVNSFQWYDGVTWNHGKHNIKAGADIKRVRADAFLGTHDNNSYTFSGQFSGDGYADFLMGNPSSSLLVLAPNQTGRFRRWQMAYYVLDDWKVTPKLTLNIGVRYEFNQVPKELGGLTPIFDPSMGNGTGGLRFPKQNTTAAPFYQNIRPDLPFALLDRESMFLPDKNNFAPRFGFAYRPLGTNKLVVRGGYGWYYSSAQLGNIVQNSLTGPPAQFWPTFSSDPKTPTLNWAGQIGVSQEQAFKTATFGLLSGPEQQWLDAYTQQWSLTIGQEVRQNLVLEAQYLGSKSTHVENSFDYNYAAPGPGALPTRVPYPKWGRVFGFSNGAAANYNALMLTAEQRLAGGLSFKGAYTFGKALTMNGGRDTAGNIGQVQNPGALFLEKGHTADDVAHRFTLNYIYELPLGRGKKLGGNMSPFANKLAAGWSVAGITTFRSGFYIFGPTISAANCNSSYNNICRPDLIGNPIIGGNGVNSPRFNRAAFDWPLNTAAHPAQPQRFGNAPMNFLTGNGLNNWDLSVLKEHADS